MPYGNSDKNTDKELYTDIARLLGVSPQTVKRYIIDGFYESIVRRIYLQRSCTIPNLGTFTLVHEPEYYQKQINENGEEVIYKVPARDKPVFTPHDTFINDVNYMGVTKAYRKRVRKNQLTAMDYRRQQRAAELGEYGSKAQERIEQSKENFKELLKKKKQKKEAEADVSDKED